MGLFSWDAFIATYFNECCMPICNTDLEICTAKMQWTENQNDIKVYISIVRIQWYVAV